MTAVEAWSAVVAGEDAAAYVYSVIGPTLQASQKREARAALDTHRSNASRAASVVTAAGGTPPPASPAYALPDGARDAKQATLTLAGVENALVAVYADAAAASTGDDRHWAARAAAAAATRAVAWGAASQAFPT